MLRERLTDRENGLTNSTDRITSLRCVTEEKHFITAQQRIILLKTHIQMKKKGKGKCIYIALTLKVLRHEANIFICNYTNACLSDNKWYCK